MWDGLSIKCGVDLPYLAYCDTLNIPVDPQLTYQEDVLWIDLQRDFRAALEYIQAGELSFVEWFKSLQGNKMWAIYDRDDWRPSIVFTLILIKKLLARII
jgi:predicted ATP-grasp superfamily ATP-dependent carboligase